MLELTSDTLTVKILDPNADRNRFGSRYCTGCYVWQIVDKQHDEIFSGPLYPSETPPVFDGQGMPDAFEKAIGVDDAKVGDEVCVIGVGRVLRSSPVIPFHVRNNQTVVEFCKWDIEKVYNGIRMKTFQQFLNTSLFLERTLILDKRELRIASTLMNTGADPIHLRWFAHPFFPLVKDNKYCRFSILVSVPENPGFYLDESGMLCTKPEHDWKRGCYYPLETKYGRSFCVQMNHPKLSEGVRVSSEFPVAWMPIWANENTFSFEPYIDQIVDKSQTASWSMLYSFGS